MPNNTVRTILIFGVIALVLGGAVVGAVRLLKARNTSYASQSQQKPNTPEPQQQAPSADPKKDETKKDEPKPQPTQSNQNTPSTTQTPTPATPSPSSQPQNTPSSVAATGATPQGSMPATGPADVFATIAMLMLAVFFSAKLLRARADYRRYVSS